MSALSEETVTIDEVAAALRITPDRLWRSWRRLHEKTGFPPPLPGGNRVWGRRAVSRWIDGPTPLVPGANDNTVSRASNSGLGDIIGAQADFLRTRYGQGAAS
ncbi:helix-turn-helix transcriptional regulator [Pleomorphomonas koreensis]|uniref:helix-turn-helix transcriptional regulator n=1 Tax=Pleomorphomonas koreensis TaxID=257440 RepID=UPI0012EB4908|nr:hypothetical protein [Pleomorphomonas koreensis]